MELLQNLAKRFVSEFNVDCLIDYVDKGWANYGLRLPSVRFANGSNK